MMADTRKGNKRWADIYAGEIEAAGGPQGYIEKKAREKRTLLRRIQRYAPPGSFLMEAGCGTGAISCHLSLLGYQVISVDAEKGMVDMARRLNEGCGGSAQFVEGDISHIETPGRKCDVVFSYGVLEHFTDEQIIDILRQERGIASTVIFAVPSCALGEKDKVYGDERFLPSSHWEALIEQSGGTVIERFVSGFRHMGDRVLYRFNPKRYMDRATFIGFVVR